MTSVKLSELSVGSAAKIVAMPQQGAAFLRLREMGLLPETSVHLVRTAPMGDPIEIKVRGYHLTLRKTEADQIEVAPIPAK